MAYCPDCGLEVNAEDTFCSNCGHDLREPAREENTTSEPEEGHQPSSARPEYPAAGGAPNESSKDADSGQLVTRRRAIIGGTIVALGLGGYVYSEAAKPKHRITDTGAWNVEETRTQRSQSIEGVVVVPEGRYAVRTITPNQTITVTVDASVQGSDSVDLYIMDDDEYDRYRERDRDFQVRFAETEVVDLSRETELGSGDYVFVIDNTGVFGATPDGEVSVDISLTVSI